MVYMYQLFAQSRARSRTWKKKGGRAMLYLRNNNLLTEQEREAVEATLSQLGLQVREVIVISLPDHLRRPWWRRCIDRICRPFRR